jgi:hypothetical protein
MSTHVLVWDLETIPDLRGFAAANGQNPMPATTHSGRCGCGSFRFRDVMVIIGFPMGSLRRKNSQGRQTSRSAGDAANQVRADLKTAKTLGLKGRRAKAMAHLWKSKATTSSCKSQGQQYDG